MKIWRQRENINEKYNEVMKMACGGVAASAKAASSALNGGGVA
jgi:hypothetical protein